MRTRGLHNLLHGRSIIRAFRHALVIARSAKEKPGSWKSRPALNRNVPITGSPLLAGFARSGLSNGYCPAGSTLTRPATTIGLPVTELLNTNPRATRFGVPAEASPESPLMFSKNVPSPVYTVNGPPAE